MNNAQQKLIRKHLLHSALFSLCDFMTKIGTSIVSVQRILYLMENKESLHQTFTSQELTLLRANHLAEILAIKQAVLQTINSPAHFLDMHVSWNNKKQVILNLQPDLAAQIKEYQIASSHDGEYAVAFVTIQEF